MRASRSDEAGVTRPEPRDECAFVTERIVKDDGRYLVFYRWPRSQEARNPVARRDVSPGEPERSGR